MRKTTLILYFCTIAGLLLSGCDSVTNPNGDGSNTQSGLSSNIGTSDNSDPNSDIIHVDDTRLGIDWMFDPETGTTGQFEFTEGPGTPLIGSGSAAFSLADDEDGMALFGSIFEGSTPLTAIEELEYNTYQSEEFAEQTTSLQFNINYDGEDDWQGRLVFEPYYEGTIITGEWQTWNALTQRGWWATGDTGAEVCPIDNPCTWDEITEAFPDAVIRAEEELDGSGLIIFKAGSNWGEFEGHVDGFSIAYNGEAQTYNFTASAEDDEEENGEDPSDPAVKEDCKNGGWAQYGFRNQGQCIRYVNTGKDSRNGEDPDNGDNGEDEENGEDPDNGDNGEDEENGEDPDNGDNGEDEENGEDPDNGENDEDEENGEDPDNGENGNNTNN
jgi:hypothetical protein